MNNWYWCPARSTDISLLQFVVHIVEDSFTDWMLSAIYGSVYISKTYTMCCKNYADYCGLFASNTIKFSLKVGTIYLISYIYISNFILDHTLINLIHLKDYNNIQSIIMNDFLLNRLLINIFIESWIRK